MTRDELGQELLNAVSQNDIAKEQALIDMGADVNWRGSSGWTPAMYAAWYGRIDFIKLLIDNGADMGIRSDDGKTAEDLAWKNKQSAAAEFLKLYSSFGSPENRAVKRNEVTVVSSFASRTLEETFNFAARERISVVCSGPHAPAQAVVREHFSQIVDQSGIEKAFDLYKEYGGQLTVDDVFPDRINKVRMPRIGGAR